MLKKITTIFDYLLFFGIKEIRSCIFAGYFFLLLAFSSIFTFGIPRYDFLFLGSVLIQILLVTFKVENLREVTTIFFFLILGFCHI